MELVVFCWIAAMAALIFAANTGEFWPLPFSLFMVVIGGVFHLLTNWYKRK